MKKKRKIVSILIAVVFVFPLLKFVQSYAAFSREQKAFENLAEVNEPAPVISEDLNEKENEEETEDETEKAELPENEERFRKLISLNDDFYGWLKIDGTNVDYPVMYKPENPDYYLGKSFEKKDSISGTPYIGKGCTPESNNIIIYGHNMRNGTMFSDLIRYQDEELYKAHSSFSLDTVMNSAEYDILAVFREKVHYKDEKGAFRYYSYAGELDEKEFGEYVRKVKELSLYDTGVNAKYGDKLVTLSTCSSHTKNGRFVIVGVKISS